MTYLLIHSRERINRGILDTFSFDVILTTSGLFHTSVFFVLRVELFFDSLFPNMEFELIPWKLLQLWPYPPQPTSLNSKFCKGRKTFFVVLYATSQEKRHGYMHLLKNTLCSFGMTKPNDILIIWNTLWHIHQCSTPQITQKTLWGMLFPPLLLSVWFLCRKILTTNNTWFIT